MNDNFLNKASHLITDTHSDDVKMLQLQKQLHALTAERLFEIFPFLSDNMEPDEIKYLGERITRHLYNLSEELKNLTYTVQHRIEKDKE